MLAAARPWLAVPQWRYFDEQHRKAEALRAAGVVTVRPHLPSAAEAWRQALDEALSGHRPDLQRALIEDQPAERVAAWLEQLAAALWPKAAGAHPISTAEASTHGA